MRAWYNWHARAWDHVTRVMRHGDTSQVVELLCRLAAPVSTERDVQQLGLDALDIAYERDIGAEVITALRALAFRPGVAPLLRSFESEKDLP